MIWLFDDAFLSSSSQTASHIPLVLPFELLELLSLISFPRSLSRTMQFSTSSLLFGALAVASGATAQSTPPANFGIKFPNGIEVLNTGYNGGLNAIPGSSYTRTKWPWGTIPRTCMNQANEGYCNPYDVEVYDVVYNDVGFSRLPDFYSLVTTPVIHVAY